MLRSLFITLFLFVSIQLFSQYSIETYIKSQYDIPSLTTFRKKYNGIFLIYNSRLIHFKSTTSFPHSYISDLLEDFNGNIWVYSPYGVSVFSDERWKTIDKTIDNKNVGGVKKVIPLSSNQIMILTYKGSVLAYKKGAAYDLEIFRRKKEHYKNLNSSEEYRTVNLKNNKPSDILVKDTTEVWISFSNNELCKLTANNELMFYVEKNIPNISKLLDYYTDSYGTNWILGGNKIIKLPKDNNQFSSIPFAGSYFKGFYEEKQRLWFIDDLSSVYYDYQTNELVDLNKKYDIKRPATDFSTVMYAVGNVGAKTRIDYYYSGIIENGFDTSIYLQYGIGTVSAGYGVVEVEKINEDALILLFMEKNGIDLTAELKDKDNRPLGAYLDSFGNFWIDTPTSIHKISLN